MTRNPNNSTTLEVECSEHACAEESQCLRHESPAIRYRTTQTGESTLYLDVRASLSKEQDMCSHTDLT